MTQTTVGPAATNRRRPRGQLVLDRYFGITAHGSTIPRELRAGFTTWLTMSYVLFVNPQVLARAIPVPNAFVQLLTTTCMAAASAPWRWASSPATRSPRRPAWA